jgi:enoyl-CoA hydratase
VFFRDDYRLIAKFAEYPKPIVSIMHGMTMGGGNSLAGHSSTRVVTDRAKLGQPETGYGIVHDGGATWGGPHVVHGAGEPVQQFSFGGSGSA